MLQTADRTLADPPGRGLLWERNFRLLLTGETVSQVGTFMAGVQVPLLAVAVLHASSFTVSALTAAEYLPWLIIGLPAGAWADRLTSRPVMVACDIIAALLYASLPVAAWLGVLSIGQVLLVALLAGALAVFFGTAYQLYLPTLIKPGELMEGNTKLQASSSAAEITGTSLAGLAAQAAGDATALLFNAASFLVSAVCLLSIRAEAPPYRPPRRGTTIRAEVREGLGFIMRDRFLRAIAMFMAAANLAYAGTTTLAIVFLVRVAGFEPAAVGLLVAAGGAGAVAGALMIRPLTERLGTARALILAALGSGLAGLLLPLTRPGPAVAFYIIGAAVMSAGTAGGSVIIVSFRQAYCPRLMLGRIITSQRILAYGTIPLGALVAGGLSTVIGVRDALWVILAIYALSGTLLLTPTIRANKNLPA
jgi:predicted MFS family arabinose efflux permease